MNRPLCTRRRRAIARIAEIVGVLSLFSLGFAVALNESKLPPGADHDAAHMLSTGFTAGVGILEVPESTRDSTWMQNTAGIDVATPKYHFIGRLSQDRYFVYAELPLVAAPPNAVGASDHGTLVSDVVLSDNGNYTGVAPAAWYFGAWMIYNENAKAAFDWYQRNNDIYIFNNSWGGDNDDNGDNQMARFVDWFCTTNDAVVVYSAANNGPPWGDNNARIDQPADAFNIITVGAVDTFYTPKGVPFYCRTDYSSYLLDTDGPVGFPALDWRGKPEIVAPGGNYLQGDHVTFKDGIENDLPGLPAHIEMDGTSFAAPHVTGVVALLKDLGLVLPGPNMRNHLAHKAIILNSARKRFLCAPFSDDPIAKDHPSSNAQESDYDYLTVGGALRVGATQGPGTPKTDDWTPTKWSYAGPGNAFQTDRPLDDELGTGVLDAERAEWQYLTGPQAPGPVGPMGWNCSDLSPAAPPDVYTIKRPLVAEEFITATLVWDRIIDERDGDNIVESGDIYDHHARGNGFLPNFDLEIRQVGGGLVAASVGAGGALNGQNVEHLHIPVPSDGMYQIRVVLNGAGAAKSDYGLAWWSHIQDTWAFLGLEPSAFHYPFSVEPNGFTDTSITLTNYGIMETNFTTTVDYLSGSGWLDIDPPSGTIPALYGNLLNLYVNVAGPATEGLYQAIIEINYDDSKATVEVPVDLYCFEEFFVPENATIRTPYNELTIQQVGRVGVAESESQMLWFENYDEFLFDGSLIIGFDGAMFSNMYYELGDTVADDNPLREIHALTPIHYDSTSYYSYRFASGVGCTADSMIAFRSEFYSSKHPDSGGFYVGVFKLTPGPNTPPGIDLNDVLIAYGTDWNIPSDTGSDNRGHVDASRQLVYQQGYYPGSPDDNDRKYGGIAYRGGPSAPGEALAGFYWESDRYLYATSDNVTGGYHADSLWKYLQIAAGWGPQPDYDGVEDSIEDLNCIVSVDNDATLSWTGGVPDTLEFYIIFAGSLYDWSESDLKASVDKAEKFICSYINPEAEFCENCKCGDADGNTIWNISDAVFLIAYIFGGGPAPDPLCLGDADGNGIVNISDAVYLISYIFGGGPEPHCP